MHGTSLGEASVSPNLTPLNELQTLYDSWPEDRVYYSQLWNYIETTGTEIPSLVLLGFQHASPYPSPISATHQEQPHRIENDESIVSNAGKVPNKRQPILEILLNENGDGASNSSHNLIPLVTEGIPSPSTVKQLALDFQVRPELLIGHIELDRAQNALRSSFELPALTSRKSNLVHVRLVSLWRTTSRNRVRLTTKLRNKINDSFRRYERELFKTRSYGSTRIRRVHIHDSQHFTIEQMVSFYLLGNFRSGSQTTIGLFMLDKGGPFDATSWSACLEGIDAGIPSIVPAVRYNEPLHQESILIQQMMASHNITHPFHPFRDCNTSKICQNLSNRPIVGLYTLISSAVLSWNQVLNFIENDIDENQE